MGGDYGAPSTVAAHPKPADGGSEVLVATHPHVKLLAILDQMKKLGASDMPSTSKEKERPVVQGPKDFRDGEDVEDEAVLVEVDPEEERVLQNRNTHGLLSCSFTRWNGLRRGRCLKTLKMDGG